MEHKHSKTALIIVYLKTGREYCTAEVLILLRLISLRIGVTHSEPIRPFLKYYNRRLVQSEYESKIGTSQCPKEALHSKKHLNISDPARRHNGQNIYSSGNGEGRSKVGSEGGECDGGDGGFGWGWGLEWGLPAGAPPPPFQNDD